MNTETRSSAPERHLLQVGVALFLFSSLWGFAIPFLASARIGLSVHTLSGFQGLLFIALGLLWPHLVLDRRALRVAFWCALHGGFAILSAYVVAAATGVGNETIALMGELPHGLVRGTPLQEGAIKLLAYSSAPTGLASFGLIFYGLVRASPPVMVPDRPQEAVSD